MLIVSLLKDRRVREADEPIVVHVSQRTLKERSGLGCKDKILMFSSFLLFLIVSVLNVFVRYFLLFIYANMN